MAFTVLPATKSDMTDLVTIFHEAFATDPDFSIIYGACDMREVIADDVAGYEQEFDRPGRKFFKVVEASSGKTVAMSKWHFPYTLTPEQEAAGIGKSKLPESYPAGTVRALADSFFGDLMQKRNELFDHETQYFVHILAVRPTHQRLGLGALLLEDGLALADRDARRTYIEASAKGLGLYLRYGWVEIGEILVDTRPYGGKQVERTKLMMREPRAGKKIERGGGGGGGGGGVEMRRDGR